MVHLQGPAIQPQQIRGLNDTEANFWNFLCQETMCILQISFEILDQLIGIIFTVRVGRLDGQGAEDVSAEAFKFSNSL